MIATHKHHRKMRSQGGKGGSHNIMLISPELHDMIHANPEVAYKHGLLVHSYDDPVEIEADIPGFLAELGQEHEHTGSCEFCGEQLHVKPKRPRKQGDERRQRRTISIKVPNDTENGGEIWDETLDRVKGRLVKMGLYSEDDRIPVYEAAIAAWQDWLDRFEETFS